MCPIENITPVVGLQSEPNVDDKQNQITPAIEWALSFRIYLKEYSFRAMAIWTSKTNT